MQAIHVVSVLGLKTVVIPVLVVSVLGLKTVPSLTPGALLIRAVRQREKCNVSGFLAHFQSPYRQDVALLHCLNRDLNPKALDP